MKIVPLIVTFNRLEKLKITIDKTLSQTFYRVVIINNASTDGTAEWLDEIACPRVTVINLNHNIGGAGGFKYGSKWIAENLRCDWVLFYDDDAFPCDNFITRMHQFKPTEHDVYTCKVIDLNGELCRMNIPWLRYPRSVYETILYIFKPSIFIVSDNKLKIQRVMSVSFVGMLINYNTLVDYYNKINEDLFIYYDDVYFSWHLIQKGIKIAYIPELIMYHDIVRNGDSGIPSWKIYFLVRNIFYAKKEFGDKSPFSKIYIIARVTKYLFLSLKQKDKFNDITMFIRGVRDGFILNRQSKR